MEALNMEYTIHPISLVVIRRNKWCLLYPPSIQYQVDEEVWLPVNIWVLKGGGNTILVDTGLVAQEAMSVRKPKAKNVVGFVEGLRKIGVEIEDIDMVLMTHLHYDHVMHLPLLKNVPVVVQEDEVRFARERHPVYGYAYNDKVQEIISNTKFTYVNGRTQILPGIELVPTPGHTRGGQAIVINTSAGKAVLSGGCAIRENFYPPVGLTDLPVITPANHYDAYTAYESAIFTKSLGDIVLPLHSVEVYSENIEVMPPFPLCLTSTAPHKPFNVPDIPDKAEKK
jgi:N-acyl homoserine lactone hydrolase